jgi:hypothetical protein
MVAKQMDLEKKNTHKIGGMPDFESDDEVWR